MFFERAWYLPVNLSTYNIYTLFCIIHIHLHTQSQKHHIWKWIHLDFWGFAVQIAKNASAYIRHTRTLQGVFTLGLSELTDYRSHGFALMGDYGPSEIINQTQTWAVIWAGVWFGAQFDQALFAGGVHRAVGPFVVIANYYLCPGVCFRSGLVLSKILK